MMLADSAVGLCERVATPSQPFAPGAQISHPSPSNDPIPVFRRLSLMACLVSVLAACGAGDSITDVVAVGSDSARTDPLDNSVNNGGDDETNTTRDTEDNNDDVGAPLADGVAARPIAGADPVSVTFNCKYQDFDGLAVLESHELSFHPGTVEFFVDNARVFNGGFNWVATTREYSAQRTATIGLATIDYFAKVEANGRPSYYRYKLTRANFSFEQVECYSGLTLS